MLILKNSTASQFPGNGGWGFKCPKTGMQFNGWEGNWEHIARKVIKFREDNPKTFASSEIGDLNSVVQEIFKQKHSTMPWLFRGEPDQGPGAYPSQPAAQQPMIVKGEKCACGSTEFEAIYCPTCSGRKITGYKCRSCGRSK